jgi:mono/diheme cytochrome c family protein
LCLSSTVALNDGLVIFIGILTLGGLSYYDDDQTPAVAEQLARQHEQTVEFMKAPFTPDTTGEAAAPEPAAKLLMTAGEKVFQSHSCFACHGEGGVGTTVAPQLVRISEEYSPQQLTYLLRHYSAGMVKGGMPKFQFSDQDLADLVAYLESLQ